MLRIKTNRLKGSVLYLVIVIALIVALICAAFIAIAYFYRSYHFTARRYAYLERNRDAGILILLEGSDSGFFENRKVSLYEGLDDSVWLSRRPWGAFEACVSRAGRQGDTIAKEFLCGTGKHAASWPALYLADEDRALSLSGPSLIRGDVYLPKAGIRTAYVDNHGYEGDPALFKGRRYDSRRALPALHQQALERIEAAFTDTSRISGFNGMDGDSVSAGFEGPVRKMRFRRSTQLSRLSLKGQLMVFCDSTLTIDSTAMLEDVLLFARAIVIKDGFRGRCQLFARDSLVVGDRVRFAYPSFAGLLRRTKEEAARQGFIRFGNGCSFFGGIAAFERVPGAQPASVILGKDMQVEGRVYCPLLSLNAGVRIRGGVYCRRFLYKSGFATYENYLIGAKIDATELSPYFVSPQLLPSVAGGHKEVALWLN